MGPVLFLVGPHVSVEVSTLAEPQVTDSTTIRLFPTMYSYVFRQGGCIAESLVAHLALVRAFPGMGPHVGRHGGGLGESSVTNWAPKRFVPSMCPNMSGQVCCLREPLVASITFVGFFARVGPHVCLQGARSGVCLATQVTQVHLEVGCRALKRRLVVLVDGELWQCLRDGREALGGDTGVWGCSVMLGRDWRWGRDVCFRSDPSSVELQLVHAARGLWGRWKVHALSIVPGVVRAHHSGIP